jgi:hypothetical protein
MSILAFAPRQLQQDGNWQSCEMDKTMSCGALPSRREDVTGLDRHIGGYCRQVRE